MSSRTTSIEGIRYRVLKRHKRGHKGELILFEPNGRLYRDGSVLCGRPADGTPRSKRKFSPKAWRQELGDVPAELLELAPRAFRDRCAELGITFDPSHFRLCGAPKLKKGTVCKTHGGESLAGVAVGKTRKLVAAGDGAKSRSLYVAGSSHRLGGQFEAALKLDQPEDLKVEVAIQRAVIADSWQALDGVDLVAIRKALEAELAQAELAIGDEDLEEARRRILRTRELLAKGSAYRGISHAINRAQRAMSQLTRTQIARRKSLDDVKGPDLEILEARVAAAAAKLVTTICAGYAPNSKIVRRATKALSAFQRDLTHASGRMPE